MTGLQPEIGCAHQPTPDFDRLAPLYRWMEYCTFGPWLWWTRCTFLKQAAQRQQALVLGDGDGRSTARLLETSSTLKIHALDVSPAMLRAMVRRSGQSAPRLKTEVADLRTWAFPSSLEPFDLIVSHFFLDCLTTEEVDALAARVRSLVQPGAIWIISEFAIPESRPGRLLARLIVRSLYLAFRGLTGLRTTRLPDHSSALRRAGFVLRQRRTRLLGLLAAELWEWEP